ncbi:PTS system mannose/fructose/N-acetylgalactosamine-transporter subunit IIB [Amphibacillus sp. Q70]|uniref:PTS system mannose/fructose/N-acetylgalactosamine-transporter subunit IIB n=1 Tax=Amphibacillus sp. Q70 TaxID=3453416 RepID=UPI003F826B97
MAQIVLCRVDSRLIHGQVVTKWVNQSQANHIVVISDELEKDDFMKSIYSMAAPPGVKVDIFGVESGVNTWKDNQFGEGNVLLLVPDLKTLSSIVNEGIQLKAAQVGGLGGGPGRKVVYQNITLDDNDVEILKILDQKELDLYFQTIPEDSPLKLASVLEKY